MSPLAVYDSQSSDFEPVFSALRAHAILRQERGSYTIPVIVVILGTVPLATNTVSILCRTFVGSSHSLTYTQFGWARTKITWTAEIGCYDIIAVPEQLNNQ